MSNDSVTKTISTFHMIDVADKVPTRRRAIAKGQIFMDPALIQRILRKDMPKGDVLALAETSGIMAAKKTSDLLPLCHPLPIEAVRIECVCGSQSIEVTSTVTTTAKTGVEMEALASVSAALLCIYDLCKIVDPVLSISEIYLHQKEGGKSGIWNHPKLSNLKSEKGPVKPLVFAQLKTAVLVLSDRCARGEAEDISGEKLRSLLQERGAEVIEKRIVHDQIELIQKAVLDFVEKKISILCLTGGTGLGPRDVTPEALEPLWTKKIPGIGEVLRSSGAQFTQQSYLSRSQAGFVGSTLVVLMPGSPKAIDQGLPVIENLLLHALRISQGAHH